MVDAGEITGEFDTLRERLGEARLRERLWRQAHHWARATHQGEGVFRLERFVSIDRLAEFALKACGLWNRAHRNIFRIETREMHWELPRLPEIFRGFRLLQVSDPHVDIDPELGPCIAEKVRQTPHDALVITGDYRNTTDKDYTPCMRAMRQIIEAGAESRFGILGNHDFIEKVWDLEAAGLPILLNEAVALERSGQALWIVGVDDAHFYQNHDFAAARKNIPQSDCSILLCHTPEVHEQASLHNFDLMLSGHTHGGQICLPGGRHLVCPVKGISAPFIKGPWKSGDLLGYTSRGTGSCGVAARLNCPPEITVHILNPA